VKRITRREWRAIARAIGLVLADESDEDTDVEALESAHLKVSERAWPDGSTDD
jgi:hypothetical protein